MNTNEPIIYDPKTFDHDAIRTELNRITNLYLEAREREEKACHKLREWQLATVVLLAGILLLFAIR